MTKYRVIWKGKKASALNLNLWNAKQRGNSKGLDFCKNSKGDLIAPGRNYLSYGSEFFATEMKNGYVSTSEGKWLPLIINDIPTVVVISSPVSENEGGNEKIEEVDETFAQGKKEEQKDNDNSLKTVQLKCPEGVAPGDRVQVDVGGGNVVQVIVPEGIKPNETFQIKYNSLLDRNDLKKMKDGTVHKANDNTIETESKLGPIDNEVKNKIEVETEATLQNVEDQDKILKKKKSWNDQYQEIVRKLHTLKRNSNNNIAIADSIYNIAVELKRFEALFHDAAIEGTKLIIEEFALPFERRTLHPEYSDDENGGSFTYLYNGLFFRLLECNEDCIQKSKEASNDLQGSKFVQVSMFEMAFKSIEKSQEENSLSVCVLPTCIVDYLGFRVQILPIARLDNDVFNTADDDKEGGDTVTSCFDGTLQSLLASLGLLYLPANVAGYCCPREGVNSLRENDFYIVRLGAMTPMNVNLNTSFTSSVNSKRFRHELLCSLDNIQLDPDVFMEMEKEEFEEKYVDSTFTSSEVKVLQMSQYLETELSQKVASFLDLFLLNEEMNRMETRSEVITSLLHAHGINIRHIGHVARKMQSRKAQMFLEIEMIGRSIKFSLFHILRKRLRQLRSDSTKTHLLKPCDVKDFANILVTKYVKMICSTLFSKDTWEKLICNAVQHKFSYSLRQKKERIDRKSLIYAIHFHCNVKQFAEEDAKFKLYPKVKGMNIWSCILPTAQEILPSQFNDTMNYEEKLLEI
eukprot:g111.t1